jgi:hypothetical protein
MDYHFTYKLTDENYLMADFDEYKHHHLSTDIYLKLSPFYIL